jgi:hypothetical protein
MLKQDTIPKEGVFTSFLSTMLLKQHSPQEVETIQQTVVKTPNGMENDKPLFCNS